jgi:hypothetical protein
MQYFSCDVTHHGVVAVAMITQRNWPRTMLMYLGSMQVTSDAKARHSAS